MDPVLVVSHKFHLFTSDMTLYLKDQNCAMTETALTSGILNNSFYMYFAHHEVALNGFLIQTQGDELRFFFVLFFLMPPFFFQIFPLTGALVINEYL